MTKRILGYSDIEEIEELALDVIAILRITSYQYGTDGCYIEYDERIEKDRLIQPSNLDTKMKKTVEEYEFSDLTSLTCSEVLEKCFSPEEQRKSVSLMRNGIDGYNGYRIADKISEKYILTKLALIVRWLMIKNHPR